MEFFFEMVFEIIMEIIMEPIVNAYLFAMTRFSKNSKNINEEKVKVFVVFEAVVLFLMFVVGAIMLLESEGSGALGKFLFFTSVTVSVLQILTGFVLRKRKKK